MDAIKDFISNTNITELLINGATNLLIALADILLSVSGLPNV